MVVEMKLPPQLIVTGQEETIANPFDIEALSSGLQAQPKEAEVYIDYTASILEQSLADGKKVVLFFHASRCPICRRLDKDIKDQLDQIPNDVQILKVNYDTENDLIQKYGVKIQHTLVSLDSDGNKTDLSVDASVETLLGLID